MFLYPSLSSLCNLCSSFVDIGTHPAILARCYRPNALEESVWNSWSNVYPSCHLYGTNYLWTSLKSLEGWNCKRNQHCSGWSWTFKDKAKLRLLYNNSAVCFDQNSSCLRRFPCNQCSGSEVNLFRAGNFQYKSRERGCSWLAAATASF